MTVTDPVVPDNVPVLPLMLRMLVLLDVNVVEPVTLLPLRVAANCTVVPLTLRLIGDAGLDVRLRVVEVPAVIEMVPETTFPFDACEAACTVTAVPGVVTVVALAKPGVVVLSVTKPVGETVQVAVPVRFLLLPSSYVPVAINCTELPTVGKVVDWRVETVIPVRVGSTKNPWQPTATAMSPRTAKDAMSWSLRRVLTINWKPRKGPFRGNPSPDSRADCSRLGADVRRIVWNRKDLR